MKRQPKIKAVATTKEKLISSWYSIQAKGAQKADILIYDEIGFWGVSAKDFATDIKALGEIKLLNVFINSPGGSVIDGTAIYNTLKNHVARIIVHIDGVALSMGSLIAMAGDHIAMAENGLMMVHNPQGGAAGESKDLRKTAEVMDKMKANMANTYAARTGIDVETVNGLMDDETWMNADEALDFGFIDEVSGEVELAASFDPTKFDNVPNHVLAQFVNKESSVEKSATQTSAVADPLEVENIMDPKEKKAAEAKAIAEAKAKKEADDAIAKKAADEALEVEGIRQKAIRAVFAPHGAEYQAVLDKCLEDRTVGIDDARAQLLDSLGKKAGSATGGEVRIEMMQDQRDKFRVGVAEAIEIRSSAKQKKKKNELRGFTLLDIAKASLKNAGISMAGLDKMRIVGAAFTHSTSDFPYLLENSIGKELQRAYTAFAETWRTIANVSSVPDFKLNSRIRLGSFNSLDTIPEGGEYEAGTMGEEKETIQALTKGKMITLTRQMIINDDLNGFLRIAGLMGRAGARTIGNDVYGIITDNAALFDGTALFHADHNNLAASGAAPTLALIGSAKTAMRKQQDPDANDYLDIQAKYIVCGVELEDTIKALIMSETDFSQANSKKANVHRNSLEVVSDPRLGATEWYLLAAPVDIPTLEIAFLDGNQTPYLESMNGFTVDGTAWKVRLDYGVTGNDFRGGYKNPGV